MSINGYTYAYGNPTNLVDASGLSPDDQYPSNPYDLTYWLYSELAFNSNSYYIRRIRQLAIGGHFNPAKASIDKLRALAAFYLLVQDRAKWDFKHEILTVFGNRSVALSTGGESQWYEYSVPGNVNYGFVGRAAGLEGLLLHGGAGWAEIRDPAHVRRGEACCPSACLSNWYNDQGSPAMYEYCYALGCYYINPDWVASLMDDPQDYASVEFGVQMYAAWGESLTPGQFEDSLAVYGWELTPAPSTPESGSPSADWPYYVGYFDGDKAQDNDRWIRLLLSRWW